MESIIVKAGQAPMLKYHMLPLSRVSETNPQLPLSYEHLGGLVLNPPHGDLAGCMGPEAFLLQHGLPTDHELTTQLSRH